MVKEFTEEIDESIETLDPDEGSDHETPSEIDSVNESISEDPPDPLAQCSEELANEKDLRLRLSAEFANYRRRMENQRIEWSVRAKSGVIRNLLPILDDLERSLDAAEQTDSEDVAFTSLKSGVSLVNQNFNAELEKLGLERIQSVGKEFDEELHEAVGQAPTPDDAQNGHVIHESQSGYRLGKQVLRHAKVIVAVSSVPAPDETES